jgi:hypothetical protein
MERHRQAVRPTRCRARAIADYGRSHDRTVAIGRDPQDCQAGEFVVAGLEEIFELFRPWTLRRTCSERQVRRDILGLLRRIKPLDHRAKRGIDRALFPRSQQRDKYRKDGPPHQF